MSDIEKITHDDTSDVERVDSDFEGHKLESGRIEENSRIEEKVEPDFEGHKLESFKIEEKLEERASE